MKSYIYIILGLIISFTSCESVIEPDLKDIEAQIVIEGNITNEAGPYTIKVSKSQLFTESSNFVGINDAFVELTDNTGIVDTLSLSENGVYTTSKIIGTPGNTYNLRIIAEGKVFKSNSTMPLPIEMDTLYYSIEDLFNEKVIFIYNTFNDPIGVKNQYRYKVSINNEDNQNIYLRDDEYFDGKPNLSRISLREIVSGDTIDVQFMCIDQATYTYYRTLSMTFDSNSASPANPISNISGDALGYFSAYTVHKKQILIGEIK